MNTCSDKLLTRAYECMEKHKAVYYDKGNYVKADFWDFAEIFEIIEDLYEVSGDRELFAMFEEMYTHAISAYGETWERNPFNDDIMWLCIACTRAYLYTGEKKYLDTAVKNFDLTWQRAFSPALGGGMFWRVENQSKNTCVNCPASVAASLIAKATGDRTYYVRAALTLDWAERMMFEPDTGKVYDCIGLDGRVSKWSSTYNQGTFIGASLLMYGYTGEERYLKNAMAAANYVKDEMYHGGVMNNEEPGNDLPGFKGILARYIRHYVDLTGKQEFADWMMLNADTAYANRNAEGLMRTQLAEKTEDGTDYDVFAMSAAVSVVINALKTKVSEFPSSPK